MWFFFGIAIGGAVLALLLWLRNHNIMVKWYEWLIGALGLLMVLMAINLFAGSQAEHYPGASWLGLLMFGVPALILLAIDWQLIARRQRAD